MTNLLRRSHAPLTTAAWEVVDAQATDILKSQLSARRFVDISGPHGWELAAVDIGRLKVADEGSSAGVPWGIREVLPLLEVRVPFVVQQMELDAIARGCKDPDLGNLQEAVTKAARFEESVIYEGMPPAQMSGLLKESPHDSVALPADPMEYPNAVSQALRALEAAGIPRPYMLVMGRDSYFQLMQQGKGGYPPHRLIEEMTGSRTHNTSALQGGVVLSAAAGNFELTLGQDWSVGYAFHDRDAVELYIAESFAFRVLEPAAAVELVAAR